MLVVKLAPLLLAAFAAAQDPPNIVFTLPDFGGASKIINGDRSCNNLVDPFFGNVQSMRVSPGQHCETYMNLDCDSQTDDYFEDQPFIPDPRIGSIRCGDN